MPEDIRRHLFDPFFTTKGRAGTGLGMSVAYGIVSRHEGTIDVATRLGHGTKFTLLFPATAAQVRTGCAGVVTDPEPGRPGRILVIDDEPPIAQLLEDVLTGAGHSVTIAMSGHQGVEMAALSEFDLVLTDLGMPDMSGWEVAGKIRSLHPEVPVILVTGWGTTLSNDEVSRAGVTAVVHKPFEIHELIRAASSVLRERPRLAPSPGEGRAGGARRS
jgi:CheY-like chemotaxis protein